MKIRFAALELRTMACTHASRHAQKVLENTSDLQYSLNIKVHTYHVWNSLICFPPSMGARFLTFHASSVPLRHIKNRVPMLGGTHYFNFKGRCAMSTANALCCVSHSNYNVFYAGAMSLEMVALERTTRIRRDVRKT